MSGSRKARTSRKARSSSRSSGPSTRRPSRAPARSSPRRRPSWRGPRSRSRCQRSRAELEQRQAALAKAKLDVARLKPLAQAKAVPQVDLDNALAAEQVTVAGVAAAEAALKDTELNQRIGIQQAQAAVEAGRAAVTQAQLDLGYTTIRAPVSGIIGRLDVDEGNLVGRGEPTLLATMSTVDPIKVSATVSEVDYLRFARRAAGRTAADQALAARPRPGRRDAPPAQGSGDHARPDRRPEDRHDRRRGPVPQSREAPAAGTVRASARRGRGAPERHPGPAARHPGDPGPEVRPGGGPGRQGRAPQRDAERAHRRPHHRDARAGGRRARDRRGPPESQARDAGEARGGPAAGDAARRWRGYAGRLPTPPPAGAVTPSTPPPKAPAAKPQGGG